jgi:ribosomal protein L37E
MKIYCPKCGNPTAYSGPKPKFCSSCGNPLSILAKKEKGEQKNYEIHEDIDIEEDPSESLNLGNMDKLEVEINHQKNSVTFGQLMENSASAEKELKGDITFTKKPSVPERTSEQVMEDFRNEAGTLRNKNA